MTPLDSPLTKRPSDIAVGGLSPSQNGGPVDGDARAVRVLPSATSRWPRILRWTAVAATALFCVGTFIRLTIADRWLITSTIYYATPWSILAGLAIVRVLSEHQRGRRTFQAGWGIAAAVCTAAWLYGSWRFSSAPVTQPAARVVLWNMAHGHNGLHGLVKSLAKLNPDIAVLVEADPKKLDVRSIFRKEFPEHHVSVLGGGLVLVSRWPAGESIPYHVGEPENECRIREIDVETPWGRWTVFAVDLGSNPFYSRREPLRELSRLVDRRGDRPVIVAGDFNTPLDSEHYEAFRNLGLKELFLTAGSGYLPTWPVPAPVLSLDQIWINEHLEPIRCEREWSWRSDHAAAIGTIAPR